MPALQSLVQLARRVIPRGWAPLLQAATRLNPRLRHYPALMRNGDTLVVDLAQPMCLGYFFDGGVPHNQGLDRLMRRVLTPGSVFVDVGANIGYYTKLARRLVGPSGRVHAFEPLPSALPLLVANALGCQRMQVRIEGNIVAGREEESKHVTVHPIAVAATKGELDFYEQVAGDTSSLAPSLGAHRVRVPVTTLDAALTDLPRLDLLKVDVEGYELEVLQGAMETISRHTPVIEFELLDGYSAARGISLDDFITMLEPLGYAFYWSNHSGVGPLVAKTPRSSDVVAIPARWATSLLAEGGIVGS